MENILSDYERRSIPVIKKKSFGSDRFRLWFGDDVWDNTIRLKCIYIDEYLDGTGHFINTVWESFDGYELEALFRDLDEEIQKKIYEIIAG